MTKIPAGGPLSWEWLEIGGASITSGQYTGDATENREIPHGLGVTPKLVLITTSASSLFGIWDEAFITRYVPTTAHKEVNPFTSTNFYVGNATAYSHSANFDGTVYTWVALG